jgi:hypothetical protein
MGVDDRRAACTEDPNEDSIITEAGFDVGHVLPGAEDARRDGDKPAADGADEGRLEDRQGHARDEGSHRLDGERRLQTAKERPAAA